MCVWFVFVFSRFSLLCIVNPCGLAVLDCWLKGRLDWERWLEIVPWNRACWTLGCGWIPLHEPLWCRFRKCRVSMKKRLQGEREEGKRGMGQMDLKRKKYIYGVDPQVDWLTGLFRQSTWCAGYHSGFELPLPMPGGLGHYSGLRRGCLRRCKTKRLCQNSFPFCTINTD